MTTFDLSYNQLLLYGVHIGHSSRNTLIYSAWMVSAFRQSISIINLVKSVLMFRLSFLILDNVISFNGPVWFINLDAFVTRYIKYSALSCGEFYISNRWVHGTISNYINIFNSYRRFTKSISSSRSTYLKKLFADWYLSRHSWPRAVFVSNLYNSYIPVIEALSLKIPALCIVDTNVWSQISSIAIPGNDESIDCLIFYNNLVSNFILYKKFNLISSWFVNTRSFSRVISFAEWLDGYYNSGHVSNSYNLAIFKPNIVVSLVKSSCLFLSLNYWSKTFKDNLDIFNVNNLFVNISSSFSLFLSIRNKFFSILNFHFFKKFWLKIGFFKRNFLTNKNFKMRFLFRNFLYRKFYTKYYLNGRFRFRARFSNRLLSTISNLFFFEKYLRVKKLNAYSKLKFKYWRYLNFLLSLKHYRTLWSFTNELRLRNKFYINVSKDLLMLKFSNYNDSKLLFKSKDRYSSLRFFVSNFSFDSYLPKYFWVWHKFSFIPDLDNLHKFFKGYFYSQALLKFFDKNDNFYYLYRFEFINKSLFLKNGYFFFLGFSNHNFYKNYDFIFNKVEWLWS